MDVYDILAQRLCEEIPEISGILAQQIVETLNQLEVLDYDILKETFLYPEED